MLLSAWLSVVCRYILSHFFMPSLNFQKNLVVNYMF